MRGVPAAGWRRKKPCSAPQRAAPCSPYAAGGVQRGAASGAHLQRAQHEEHLADVPRVRRREPPFKAARACVRVCVRARVRACLCARARACVFVLVRACVYVCARARVRACVHVCARHTKPTGIAAARDGRAGGSAPVMVHPQRCVRDGDLRQRQLGAVNLRWLCAAALLSGTKRYSGVLRGT